MATGFPQIDLRNVWTVNNIVTPFEMFFPPEILDNVPDSGALWMPKG